MKKRTVGMLVGAAVLSLTMATGALADDAFRVAYIARAQEDSFAAWLADELRAQFDTYDDMTLDVFDGQANDEKENSLIENCIANGYDGIIIQANNGEAQLPYIQQVVDAGIPCITTNPRVECEGTGSIDADPYEQAKVNCDIAVDQIPENAKVVVLLGPAGNFHSTERRNAWQAEFFDKRPDVEIVAEDIANWNKDEAMTLMEDWVQANDHIDAIISMNDNMAAGAIEAIRNNTDYIAEDGTPSFLAYGVDGTAQGCLLIKEGFLTATALQDAGEIAQLNMSYAEKVLNGEMDYTEVNDYVDAPEINIDNVDEFIQIYIANGELSEDALS